MTQGLELRGAVLGKGYRLGRNLDDETNAFEGTHERIPGRFVIRLFPPETMAQPESSSRIQRAARVASLLRHPHALQILDFNASGETPAFVVMERQAGQSLAAVMGARQMLPLPQVMEIVDCVASALAAGHRVGLVHGDLRPGHVIMPSDGQPAARLSGFGWAKELRAAARVVEPSPYLAPEQNSGQALTLDERVDQYALAVLTYELVAGTLPVPQEPSDEAKTPTVNLKAPTASAENAPAMPAKLGEVLRRALSPSAADRFASISELASQIRGATADGGGAGTAKAAATATAMPTAIKATGPEMPAAAGARAPATPTVDAGAASSSNNASASSTAVTPIPGPPAATPATATSDVTEELDLGTLAPVRAEAKSADEIEDTDTTPPVDVDVGGDKSESDEETEDVKLVLGPTSGPISDDDARTQVRRSPFFQGEQHPPRALSDDDDDGDDIPTAYGSHMPKRGMPVGLPSSRSGPHSASRPILAPVIPPIERSWAPSTGMSGFAQEKLSNLWAAVRERPAWVFPAATGVGLVLIVGAMVWMSREPAEDTANPPAVVAERQPVPGAAAPATAPPATDLERSARAPGAGAAPSAAVTAPAGAPGSAGPSAQPVPAVPAPSAKIAPRVQPVPGTVIQPAPNVDGRPSAPVPVQASRPAPRRIAPRPARAPVEEAEPAPEAPPAAGASGGCSIRISSRPWAEVWIDGKNTGRKTPVDNLKVGCGTRKLQLKRPDKDIEQMEMLTVTPGKPYRGDYELE